MAGKKEKLKFYRLTLMSDYSGGTAAANYITGYNNIHDEFSKYDIEDSDQAAAKGYYDMYPKLFFSDYLATPEGIAGNNAYNNLSFVIRGRSEKYDRVKHDLDALSSDIYIITASTDNIMYGTPRDNLSNGSTVRYLRPGIDSPKPKFIEFRINPSRVRIIKKKYFNQMRTRGGWAFQHWGPQIGEVQLEGTTGNIVTTKIGVGKIFGIPTIPTIVDEIPDEVNSPALAAFRELESWYDADQSEQAQVLNQILALEYRGRIYIGHFAEFSFDELADRPFQLYYKIKFLIHFDTGNLTAALQRASYQITRNEQTIAALKQLQNTTTTVETAIEVSPSAEL